MTKRNLVTFVSGAVAGVAMMASGALAQTISIGSNPQGSLFYATGTAISGVMSVKTDSQYRVAPFGGSSTYLPMVDRGELEFGLTNSGEAAFAYSGTAIFDGRPNKKLRQVAALFPAINGWMVPAGSDVKTVADLKGRRVSAEFVAGRTFHYIAGSALAASHLTWDDVVRVPVPQYVAGIDMLIDGRLDAAYSTVGVAAAKRAMATVDGGIRFLPIDASGDVNKRIDSVMPTAVSVELHPSKANDGIVEDPTTLVKTQFVLLAGEDTDEETVYQLTKTLYEHQADLATQLGAFKRFDPKAMMAASPVPYHPGALRFYREVGLAE